MSRTRWKSKETKFGCWNWLFVVAEQDQIMTIFSIYRIYGGVMGDMTKIYKIIQPKMAEVTACKCKKKITNDKCLPAKKLIQNFS